MPSHMKDMNILESVLSPKLGKSLFPQLKIKPYISICVEYCTKLWVENKDIQKVYETFFVEYLWM